jgi:hypothetical protein
MMSFRTMPFSSRRQLIAAHRRLDLQRVGGEKLVAKEGLEGTGDLAFVFGEREEEDDPPRQVWLDIGPPLVPLDGALPDEEQRLGTDGQIALLDREVLEAEIADETVPFEHADDEGDGLGGIGCPLRPRRGAQGREGQDTGAQQERKPPPKRRHSRLTPPKIRPSDLEDLL